MVKEEEEKGGRCSYNFFAVPTPISQPEAFDDTSLAIVLP